MPINSMRPPGHMVEGLQQLAKDFIPENAIVAEVGSFAGESTEIFLNTGRVSFLLSVDPFSDELASDIVNHNDHKGTKMSEVKARFMERMSKFPGKVTNLPGMTSVEVAAIMASLGVQFDLVYIDARHEVEPVKEDITAWGPLVKPGGCIAGHDWDHAFVKEAVLATIGQPPHLYCDNSWAIPKRSK